MPEEKALVPKRKYTRKPKVEPQVKKHGAPLALAEVDRQLAAAVQSLPSINEYLSQQAAQSALWQDRLNRAKQSINELVALQQQLDGVEPGVREALDGYRRSGIHHMESSLERNSLPHVPNGEIPPGISSIPAKRQPQAGPSNAASMITNDSKGWS